MNVNSLKNGNDEIYIFGAEEELSCVAVSLLWSLDKSPAAFIDEDGKKQGTSILGVPVLSLDAALSNAKAPTILFCPYSKTRLETVIRLSNGLCAAAPVFWSPYDIERAYMEEKRSTVSFSKVESLIGADMFPCGVLSRYQCSVERDYETAIADIEWVAAHAQAIKYLEIRTPSILINYEFVDFLKRVSLLDNVLYIAVKTDPYHDIPANVLKKLEQLVLKIDFYNFPESGSCAKASFERIGGRIPFSYTEQDTYFQQMVGYDAHPLTTARLNELISKDLGMEIQRSAADDREICLVNVSGGLGNQILAYLLACFAAENTSKLVIIDDMQNHIFSSNHEMGAKITETAYSLGDDQVKGRIPEHFEESAFLFNRLELYEIFSCEFGLFSELYSGSVRNMLLKKLEQYVSSAPLFSYLSALNCKMTYYSDRYIYKRQQINAKNHIAIDRYYTDDANLSSNVWLSAPMENSYYAHIYLTNFHLWNKSNREWAQTKLRFPQIEDEYNHHMAARIMGCDSVVVHVRRKDLRSVNSSHNPQYTAYFRAAIHAVTRLAGYAGKKYFVFSDDVEWCRSHEEELGFDLVSSDITYVDQNSGKSSFRDMQLMSMGKIMIFPPCSSFSFCAFILNAAVERYISYQSYTALCSYGLSGEALYAQLPQDAG